MLVLVVMSFVVVAFVDGAVVVAADVADILVGI